MIKVLVQFRAKGLVRKNNNAQYSTYVTFYTKNNFFTMIPTYLPKPQSNCPSPYRLIRTLSFHFFYWILLSHPTLTVPTTCYHSILPSRSSSTTSEKPSKNSKILKFSGSPGSRAKSMRLAFTIMPPGRPPGREPP